MTYGPDLYLIDVRTVHCPRCGAEPGQPCMTNTVRETVRRMPHRDRMTVAFIRHG